MSTFSSVVRKPNQKFAPKITPRRNLQRSNQTRDSLTPTNIIRSDEQRDLGSNGVRIVSDSAGREVGPENENQDEIQPTILPTTDLHSVQALETNSHAVGVDVPQSTLSSNIGFPGTSEVLRSTSVSIPIVSRGFSGDRGVSGIPVVLSHTTDLDSAAAHRISEPLEDGRTGSEQDGERSPKRRRTHIRDDVNFASQQRTEITRSASLPVPSMNGTINRNSTSLPPPDDVPAESLLQSATARAAAVSELANSIQSRLRSTRSEVSTQSEDQQHDSVQSNSHTTQTRKSRAARRQAARDKHIADTAAEIVQQAITGGRSTRRRPNTPDDAEQHEIEPEAVKMADLTKDSKLGKRSERDRKIEENWSEILNRRKEQLHQIRENIAKGKNGRQTTRQDLIADGLVDVIPVDIPIPETTIVNGQIVIRDESRLVDFSTRLQQVAIRDADTALEDAKIYKYVHQGTLGRVNGTGRGYRWNEENTELFYKGLRMFGTDFMMITNLFPGASRKQIKLKYVREERTNLARIRESLGARESIELSKYSQMTNLEFTDPEIVQKEIEADEKKLREEDEKRRRDEGYIHDDGDTIVDSRELEIGIVDGEGEDVREASRELRSSARSTDRIAAEAARIVAAAVSTKKRSRKDKTGAKTKATKRGRKALEGVEERIGPIDEVD